MLSLFKRLFNAEVEHFKTSDFCCIMNVFLIKLVAIFLLFLPNV